MFELSPLKVNIPRVALPDYELVLNPGNILFLLGANGSGKSSLLHLIQKQNPDRCTRITAHRQAWFTNETAGIMSTVDRSSYVRYIAEYDSSPSSRWTDNYSDKRPVIIINDIIAKENKRSRDITFQVDNNPAEAGNTASHSISPIATLNKLFEACGSSVRFFINGSDEMCVKNEGQTYHVPQLSDGERNLLLIASNVLTAPPRQYLLIDEPERHLHRSMTSPLLSELFKMRSDCSFIISTHDVELPTALPEADVIMLRSCVFNSSPLAGGWIFDQMSASPDFSEQVRRDILGSRKKLLFIEGDLGSLDFKFYASIFPRISILPRGGCREVRQAVTSLRMSGKNHWLSAHGIVDNDGLSEESISILNSDGVFVLPVNAVESIFYLPAMQRLIGSKLVEAVGGDLEDNLQAAKNEVIKCIVNAKKSLCALRVAKKVKTQIEFSIPNEKNIASESSIEIKIDCASLMSQEENAFQAAVDSEDDLKLLTRYAIKKSGILKKIAVKLGFSNRDQYEDAVIKALRNKDPDALNIVYPLFDQLVVELGTDNN